MLYETDCMCDRMQRRQDKSYLCVCVFVCVSVCDVKACVCECELASMVSGDGV